MKKVLQILNILGFLAVVAVNALAVLLPINNRTTEQLSDMYPNLFVPAGITFSIWGAIYILLLLFTLYQSSDLLGGKADRTGFVDKAGLAYFLTSILNIGWILAWHYEMVLLSVLIMLGLLASLIVLYLRIGSSSASFFEKLFSSYPISVYLGWISVATIANITAYLINIGWEGFGISPETWTYVMMGAAMLLALLMRFLKDDIPYCLVIVWALAGIAIKRLGTEPQYTGIAYTAIAMAAVVVVSFLFRPQKKA
ncbi:MAG TPA: hypothetical protein PLI88_05875 [Bacillota bacterium]|nr:hypothetical protein [Bacillota bacterium]